MRVRSTRDKGKADSPRPSSADPASASPVPARAIQVPDPFLDVIVDTLSVDPITGLPVVVLLAESGERLPISIGLSEASAIASELEQIRLERPMTHDLMRDLLVSSGLGVDRVEIAAYREGIYYATVWVDRGENRVPVDARPSDAIALALRTGAPVRAARTLLAAPAPPPRRDKRQSRAVPVNEPAAEEPVLQELLASLPDEEFGKWKM